MQRPSRHRNGSSALFSMHCWLLVHSVPASEPPVPPAPPLPLVPAEPAEPDEPDEPPEASGCPVVVWFTSSSGATTRQATARSAPLVSSSHRAVRTARQLATAVPSQSKLAFGCQVRRP